ncbi:MAG: hypothetical protein K0R09_216 [Clostridiales bacterium]|nr:hypothetical protein [Clostridiales bacterium]
MITNLKKRTGFIIMILVITTLFIGCNKQENSNNSLLKSIGIESLESDALAVIINNPSDDKLDKVTDLKTFEYDKTSNETLLLVPRFNKMSIEIKSLVWENDALKEDETIYKEENTKDGFGLFLRAYRPEGSPAIKICVEGNDMKGEYILSYNGKDGTPDIEYIVKE